MLAIVIELAILAGLLVLLRAGLRGAPFIPSKPIAIREMVEFAGSGAGRRIAELGSGDGRVVIALARAGATVDGYERNPLLVWWSRRKVRQAGVAGRVKIYRKDFWGVNLSGYDAVVVFGMSHIMKRLAKKFQAELGPGTRIVSNAFRLPGFKITKRGEQATAYRL